MNRRDALAGTGVALSAAILALAPKPAAAMSSAVADAVEHYHSSVAAMNAAYAAHDAALAAPDCPPSPAWKGGWPFRDEVVFRNVTEARLHANAVIRTQRKFADMLAPTAPEKPAMYRYIAKVEEARDRAVADLRAMKKAYQPVKDLSDEADRRWSIAYSAFTALLAVPCATLADIKSKIEIFAAAGPAVGSELEYEESKALLRSFLEAR